MPPQHHDGVNINFLTSGVAMRLQLRVSYPEKIQRVESGDLLGASTLLTRVLHTQYRPGRHIKLVRYFL